MPERQIIPWFGGSYINVQTLGHTDKVAYSWSIPAGADPATHVQTINDLLVWHDCDKNLWRADPEKDQSKIDDYLGWHPSGVGLHDLISVDPLHIEASVYWPVCCGMHGWIRDGAWVNA